jgi:hypothetical protein
MKLGLQDEKAARSALNQRGPWFNAGAFHMNLELPIRYFEQYGLICMFQMLQLLGPVYHKESPWYVKLMPGGVREGGRKAFPTRLKKSQFSNPISNNLNKSWSKTK